MSLALAALSRNLIPLLTCITLAACNGSYTAFESDRDFDADVKTADIEQSNVELMILGAYQSAFLGHYQSAAYYFLDASDLPVDAVQASVDNQFQRICSNGGTAIYTYSRGPGEVHAVGDVISVAYDNCIEGDAEYNGSMTGTYSKLRGLNDRFVNISSSECIDNLKSNLSVADTNIIYLTGDEVRFTRVSDELKVEVILFVESSSGDNVESIKEERYINKLDKAIVVHQPTVIQEGAVTSINGDRIYSIADADNNEEFCQIFERSINVQFNHFSTNKTDYLYTSLNGTVTILDSQETTNRVNQSFLNSNFTTTVSQGNTTEVYSMKDYSVEQAINKADDTYSYVFNGLISNDNLLKGQVSLTTLGRLLGSFGSTYPKTGIFEMKARGLERVLMVPDNLNILLRVDFNGDSTGNGFGDFDIFINTTWPDLFSRNFKE
ncbi:MAG: hypothetical protein ACJAS1_002145 [Oleiphilaceae bacterium]|jgi:hypothetical protein